MISPLIKTIEVPCDQETAFNVFVHEMDSWWPLSRFTVSAMSGRVARGLRIDPQPGGEIVEIDPSGSEHLWGTVNSYDPYSMVSMNFHIPPPGTVVEDRSLVEVRFTELEKERTRVELKQTNWEALGDIAEAMRGGYDGGWTIIFEQSYKAACGG